MAVDRGHLGRPRGTVLTLQTSRWRDALTCTCFLQTRLLARVGAAPLPWLGGFISGGEGDLCRRKSPAHLFSPNILGSSGAGKLWLRQFWDTGEALGLQAGSPWT